MFTRFNEREPRCGEIVLESGKNLIEGSRTGKLCSLFMLHSGGIYSKSPLQRTMHNLSPRSSSAEDWC